MMAASKRFGTSMNVLQLLKLSILFGVLLSLLKLCSVITLEQLVLKLNELKGTACLKWPKQK